MKIKVSCIITCMDDLHSMTAFKELGKIICLLHLGTLDSVDFVAASYSTLLVDRKLVVLYSNLPVVYNNIQVKLSHLGPPLWVIGSSSSFVPFQQTAQPRYWLPL